MTDLKPAADEEPVLGTNADPRRLTWSYLETVRDAARRFGTIDDPGVRAHLGRLERDIRQAQGLPVTPPRPLRLRVDTGPVGYLWLEWLGACARVAGIAPEPT